MNEQIIICYIGKDGRMESLYKGTSSQQKKPISRQK